MVEFVFGGMLLAFCLMSGTLSFRVGYVEARRRREDGERYAR